jgi:uncharacterized protein DUF6882
MERAEAAQLRREILAELSPLLRGELVADAWGRAIVEVGRSPGGEPVVVGIDVEEIVGDEARIDAAFSEGTAREFLPALAKATEALCALEGVDLDEVRGGTFVHFEDQFAWLPGLVRTPSRRLDSEREGLMASMHHKNNQLQTRFAGVDRVELDVEAGILRWLAPADNARAVGIASVVPIGTFARAQRMWGWAWGNPNIAETTRKASAALADAVLDRDLWEITTPAFATDESTAWLLAALICDRARAIGVKRMVNDDLALFVLVVDVRDA